MLDVQADQRELSVEALTTLLVKGDISGLSPADKLIYYKSVCDACSLDHRLQPFDYLKLQGDRGKETLYLNSKGTAQLRKVHGISITRVEREWLGDCFGVTAYGTDRNGRCDSALGVVYIKGLQGEALSNALMRAETKSKRRLTISLAGLGILDESEVDSIYGAQRVTVDHESGEVLPAQTEVVSRAPFIPLRDQAPDQDETIRNADDPLWQRWLVVQGEASGLGINVPRVGLPMPRRQLTDLGRGMTQAIQARQDLLKQQQAQEPMATSRNALEVRELDEVLAALAAVDHDDPKLHITGFPAPLALVNANLAAAKQAYAALEAAQAEQSIEGTF